MFLPLVVIDLHTEAAKNPDYALTLERVATSKNDYSLETYILSTNHYQIELLSGTLSY